MIEICDICNLNNIGDEFHYLFECTFFEHERKKLLVPFDVLKNPNTVKFYDLFNNVNYNV
jgi:hypothetical protein